MSSNTDATFSPNSKSAAPTCCLKISSFIETRRLFQVDSKRNPNGLVNCQPRQKHSLFVADQRHQLCSLAVIRQPIYVRLPDRPLLLVSLPTQELRTERFRWSKQS